MKINRRRFLCYLVAYTETFISVKHGALHGIFHPFEGHTLYLFVGRHNFASFTSKDADARGFVRTIEAIDVANKGKETSVVFKGDGFLTYQIRFIVGAAFKVAYGELPLEEVKKRIDAEERSILSYKAPAEGLTLVYVGYE